MAWCMGGMCVHGRKSYIQEELPESPKSFLFVCLENEEKLLKHKSEERKEKCIYYYFFLTEPSFRENGFCLELLLPREASV